MPSYLELHLQLYPLCVLIHCSVPLAKHKLLSHLSYSNINNNIVNNEYMYTYGSTY